MCNGQRIFTGSLGWKVATAFEIHLAPCSGSTWFARGAQLMPTRTSAPVVAHQQAVLFYLYSPNLPALREHLLANGVNVSSIAHPQYMPKGGVRVEDPDGYVLLIGQSG